MWLNRFVTRCHESCKKKSLSGKISVEKHKEVEIEERIKRYKVEKNRFQIMEESELFLLNALLSYL